MMTAEELFTELILRRPDRVAAIASRALAFENNGDADSAFAELIMSGSRL